MRAIGRLIVVVLSFVISVAISGAVLLSLGLERLTQATHGRDLGDLKALEILVELVSAGAYLVSGATLVPALAVVVIGEIGQLRGWLYYVAGGGLAAGAIPLAASHAAGTAASLPQAGVWQVFATAGFVGGFIYWMLAGRNS